jgi:hypothetical protein
MKRLKCRTLPPFDNGAMVTAKQRGTGRTARHPQQELACRAIPFSRCRGSVTLRDWIIAGRCRRGPGHTCSPQSPSYPARHGYWRSRSTTSATDTFGCRIAVGLTGTSTKQTKGCDIARSYAKQLSALLGVPVFAPRSPAFRWIVLGLRSDCRVQLATEKSSRPANRHTGEARIEIDSTALTVDNLVSDSNCMVQ